jgi:Zn-dependent peptidase ImmA (M78 family)
MRTIKISKNLQLPPERIQMLRHFIAYVFRAIQLGGEYKVLFVDDRHKWGLETTGSFSKRGEVIIIYAKGRSFVDILRSTAHECIHAKQYELGNEFSHDYLHFDSESEDEANAIAGELVNAYSEVMGHDAIYENY